jgi:hypothetical protein
MSKPRFFFFSAKVWKKEERPFKKQKELEERNFEEV